MNEPAATSKPMVPASVPTLHKVISFWKHPIADPQPRTFALAPREWVAIGVVCATSLAVHLYFRMRGFGEQDSARFAIYALTWRHTGEFPIDTYTNRTSPLYLIYMRLLLAAGLKPLAIPTHINYLNVIFGSFTLLPLFLLFRKLARDYRTALLGVAIYWFTPAFWVGNSYGMPHIPALAFMLVSLLCFVHALPASGRAFHRYFMIATVTMCVAVCLKSDIVLCGLAYPALVLCVGPITRRNLLASLPIPVVAVATVMIVSRVFLPVPESATAFAKSWNETFPFTAKVLLDPAHWEMLKNALGGVLWLAAGGATLVILATRERKLVLLTLAWLLPTSVFWGLISGGNAVRHFTMALCPVGLLIAVALRYVFRAFPLAVAGAALLLYVNYGSAPPSENPHAASPRLVESFALMQRRNSNLMEFGRRFALEQAPQKLLSGYWAIPYSEYAVLARADRFTRKVIKPAGLWDIEVWSAGRPTPTLVRIRYGPQPTPEFQERGSWFIFNPERGQPM